MFGLLTRPVAWRFYIQVDGIIYGEFTECTGLEANRETIPVNVGGSLTPIQLPGRVTESNIVLKRGMISTSLWKWLEDGSHSGLPKHRSLMILLASADGIPLYHWDVSNVYPVKWTGPSLSADSSALALESLELARGGSGSSQGSSAGGDDTSGAQDKINIDQLSVLELEKIADNTLRLMKRDLLFERERSGPG